MALASLALVLCPPASAAPGDVDSTFGVGGTVLTDLGEGGADANGVAVQPDGNIVAAGDNGDHFVLARYRPDGSLDGTFSGDGRQVDGPSGSVSAIALQPDGKVLAVGSSENGMFAAARYNPNGSLDPTFSGDGVQTIDFALNADAGDVALQNDGKIVLVGGSSWQFSEFAVARLNPDGSLDTTFSGDGRQTTNLSGASERATGVAIQDDGRIVVVGRGEKDLALARYTPDGLLDPSFAGDGVQMTDFGTDNESANDVAIQDDGKIVAAGYSSGRQLALARYNTDGSLDPSFSGDGKTDAGPGPPLAAEALVLQPNGKIAVVGGKDFALARYNGDGSLDRSFSGDGRQTTDLGGESLFPSDDFAGALALQADGKLVVSGFGGVPSEFTVARYGSDGALDPGFSGDGKQMTAFPPSGHGGLDDPSAVAVQRDGRVVVAGGSDFAVALARYSRNGALDPSFSGDGKQLTRFRDGYNRAVATVVRSDGKVVVLTRGTKGSLLIRYNRDGSLDRSFSGDGMRPTISEASALAQRRDADLVVVGGTKFKSGDFAVARYNPDGSLDRSFSGDGKQRTKVPGSGSAKSVALLPHGKIVAAGVAERTNESDFAVVRYNGDGSLDRSFSRDGRQTTDLGTFDSADAIVLQPGGRIVVVGSSIGEGSHVTNGVPSALALARYRPNGSLDKRFSSDGRQLTDLGVEYGSTDAVAQPDGRIVVSGHAFNADGFGIGSALARYHPDGSLDKSFSGNGKQIRRFDHELIPRGVAAQPGGRIVVAARGSRSGKLGDADFALLGYKGGRRRAVPVIRRFRLRPARLRAAHRTDGGSGSAFGYRLSRRARVAIAIERRVRGRRSGSTCVEHTPRRRPRRACMRYVRVSRLSRTGRTGQNRHPFSGWVGLRKLRVGSYRASVRATDRQGYASRVVRTRFRIVAKPD